MNELLQTIKPVEIVRLGGAGGKCVSLVEGQVDCYIHPSGGLKNWDMCGPESVVNGMGCFGTDFLKEKLRYSLNGDKRVKGLILCRNQAVYNLVDRRMGLYATKLMKTFKL